MTGRGAASKLGRVTVFWLLSALLVACPVQARQEALTTPEPVLESAAVFEPNVGQVDPRVKFLSRASGYVLYLNEREMVLDLARSRGDRGIVRMRYVGGNRRPAIVGGDELPGKVNYFRGDDPRRWRRNVSTYATVTYRGVYPGVDLVYYGGSRGLEYDFVVAPGADPAVITLAFEGPERLALSAEGDLLIKIGLDDLRMRRPIVYQDAEGSRKLVSANYVLRGKDRVGVQVAAYDRTRALIIDPVLVYSTYLGGSGADIARGIAADPATPGVVYVAGETTSANFPTTAGFQPGLSKGSDCFIAKLDTRQSGPASRVYTTYLGGSGTDQCYGVAVDGSQNTYVVGRTTSTNFPLAIKLNGNNRGGSDAIVVKLNATGASLLYSVYLGGSADEWGFGIAVDSGGQAYVTGLTTSSNFPVVGGFQASLADSSGDAFVTKINAAGSAFLYSTYLGGNATDQGQGIAADPAHSGVVYVTGDSSSTNWPVKNAFQLTPGGSGDAFVAKVDTGKTGSASLLYSTYLGGNGVDRGRGIATDGVSAYVTGQTASENLYAILSPPPRSFDTQLAGSSDAFVARVDTNASGQPSVSFFTYLGGGVDDSGNAIAVDGIANVYVTGHTFGGLPITADAFQSTLGGGSDAFVARLDTNASGAGALVSASYLGGSGSDQGNAIALDASGDGYVTGPTSSTSASAPNIPFPTVPGGFQTTYGGGASDAFVVRIADIARTADLSIAKSGPASGFAGTSISYTLSVSNAGPNTASAVSVTDPLPAGTTLVSAGGTGWNCGGSTTVTCSRSSLAVGPAPAITITVTAAAGGTLTNAASVSAATADPNHANNTSAAVQTTVTAEADLSITKTGPASVNISSPIAYTLSVANAGPSPASAISVTDTLPAGTTLVSAGGTGWSCSGSTTITCTRPSLGVGAAPDIVISVTAPAEGGNATNSASVSSTTSDPTPGNNSATAQTMVIGPPIFTFPTSYQIKEGELLSFQATATDPQGLPLTFSASNLPFGASFNPGTRTFTWTPTSAQGGDNPYLVYITANDGQFTRTITVTIVVVDSILDGDGDGVPDGVDNCPDVYNPDQFDVCHNSPESVTADSALSQSGSTQGPLNLTFTATLSGGTGGTHYVPVNLFNTICRVTDGGGNEVPIGAVPEGPPIVLSPSPSGVLVFIPAGSSQDSAVTFDLKLLYPNLASGTYTVSCDYVNFAHIPQPVMDDPTIWRGKANAQSQTVIVGLYAFTGFASPADHEPFNVGRTVPVKFSLIDSSGAFVTTAVARLFIQRLDSQGNKVGPLLPATGNNSTDNLFRVSNNQYIFNMSTDNLTAGLWQLVVKLDNGTTETIIIILR